MADYRTLLITPASAHWLDGCTFHGGEPAEQAMTRCLETPQPFTKIPQSPGVVVGHNVLALLKGLIFFKDFAGTDVYLETVTKVIGWHELGSSQCTQRIINRYTKAREAILSDNDLLGYVPAHGSDLARVICPLIDTYRSINVRSDFTPMTPAQLQHLESTIAVREHMDRECPETLLGDITALTLVPMTDPSQEDTDMMLGNVAVIEESTHDEVIDNTTPEQATVSKNDAQDEKIDAGRRALMEGSAFTLQQPELLPGLHSARMLQVQGADLGTILQSARVSYILAMDDVRLLLDSSMLSRTDYLSLTRMEEIMVRTALGLTKIVRVLGLEVELDMW